MFCAPEHIFDTIGSVGSRFHVLRSRSLFRRFRGRRVPFSCFARPHSLSMEPRASALVFMFCASELIFDDTWGVESRFYVLRARSHFRRYRGRRVPFSYFALPDSFSVLPRASCSVFMFYVPGHIFGGIEGVGSRFNILRSRTRFRRYRGRRVPFSCFARPESFSAVPRASGPFSCFAVPYSFSVVPRATGTVSYFTLPGSFSAFRRASGPVFMFCAAGLVFSVTKGVWSRFHVLRSRTHFRR
jgi:hypothetical protein